MATPARRETLSDFFDYLARASAQFLVYDDGFRMRSCGLLRPPDAKGTGRGRRGVSANGLEFDRDGAAVVHGGFMPLFQQQPPKLLRVGCVRADSTPVLVREQIVEPRIEPHVRHAHSCSWITDDGTDLHVRDIVSHRPGVNILASFANRVFPLRPHRKVSSCHGSILEEPLTHSQREDGTQRLPDLWRKPQLMNWLKREAP